MCIRDRTETDYNPSLLPICSYPAPPNAIIWNSVILRILFPKQKVPVTVRQPALLYEPYSLGSEYKVPPVSQPEAAALPVPQSGRTDSAA